MPGGFLCCSKTTVRLSTSGRLVKKASVTDWRGGGQFSKVVRKQGWYIMRVATRQWSPLGRQDPGHGSVWLRSVVKDASGGASTETIQRAYGIG
jgi:hypothetical protein